MPSRFFRLWFWKEQISTIVNLPFELLEKLWPFIRTAYGLLTIFFYFAAWSVAIVAPIAAVVMLFRIQFYGGSTDINDVNNGLVVEGIGVFVELLAVYLVLNIVIKFRDDQKWKPMRGRFYEVLRDDFIEQRSLTSNFLSEALDGQKNEHLKDLYKSYGELREEIQMFSVCFDGTMGEMLMKYLDDRKSTHEKLEKFLALAERFNRGEQISRDEANEWFEDFKTSVLDLRDQMISFSQYQKISQLEEMFFEGLQLFGGKSDTEEFLELAARKTREMLGESD